MDDHTRAPLAPRKVRLELWAIQGYRIDVGLYFQWGVYRIKRELRAKISEQQTWLCTAVLITLEPLLSLKRCFLNYGREMTVELQGYLAHTKTPTPLGPPKDPRHRPLVGS